MKKPAVNIKVLLSFLLALLTGGALIWLYFRFDHDINHVLADTNHIALLELAVLGLMILLIRAYAWEWVYRSGGGKSLHSDLHFSSSMTYLANLVFPPYIGNLLRPLVMKWLLDNKGTTSQLVFNDASVLAIEAILHIPLLLFLLIKIEVNVVWVLLGILIIFGVALGLWFLRHKYAHKSWTKGFAIFQNPRDFLSLAILSAFVLTIQIVRNYIAIEAVGLDGGWAQAVAVFVLTSVFALIPAGPAPSTIGAVLLVFHSSLAYAAAAGLLLTLTGAVSALLYVLLASIFGLPLIFKRRKKVHTN